MKRLVVLLATLTCILGMTSCQKTIDASTVYGFSEPTIQINGSFYSQGIEQTFVIGPEEYDPDNLYALPVIDWFYGLELWECEEPETGEEEDIYSFAPDKYSGFTYVDRGNKAFLVVNEKWYRVKNPSNPPLE